MDYGNGEKRGIAAIDLYPFSIYDKKDYKFRRAYKWQAIDGITSNLAV